MSQNKYHLYVSCNNGSFTYICKMKTIVLLFNNINYVELRSRLHCRTEVGMCLCIFLGESAKNNNAMAHPFSVSLFVL